MAEKRKVYAVVFWPKTSRQVGLPPTVVDVYKNEGTATVRYLGLLATSSLSELWLLEYTYSEGYEPIRYSKLARGADVKLSARSWPKQFTNDLNDALMDEWHKQYDANIQDDVDSDTQE